MTTRWLLTSILQIQMSWIGSSTNSWAPWTSQLHNMILSLHDPYWLWTFPKIHPFWRCNAAAKTCRVARLIYCPVSTGAQHTVQIEAGRVLIFVIIRWSNDAASLWWPPPYNPPPQDLIKHQRTVVWFKSPPHHSFRIFDAATTCAHFSSSSSQECVEWLKLYEDHKSCPWWYFAPNRHVI